MSGFFSNLAAWLVVFATTVAVSSVAVASPPAPNLVPWPQSVIPEQASLPLSGESRIVAQQAELEPLARVLAEEIQQIAGLKMAIVRDGPCNGDIVLTIDPKLAGEAYGLQVADRATVRGGNYGAVALGTVTVLQALVVADGSVSLPRFSVDDAPKSEYRGLMIDVARQYHSIKDSPVNGTSSTVFRPMSDS